MEDTNDSTGAVRINGALMANYLQAKAIIVGFVTKFDADGKRATLKTTDDQFIQVLFLQPLNFDLQTNQLIEAYGTVVSRSQFQCISFTHFLPEVSEEFNCQLYNKFINYFLNNINRINVTQPVDEESETVLKTIDNDFDVDWKSMNGKSSETSFMNETINDYDSWN